MNQNNPAAHAYICAAAKLDTSLCFFFPARRQEKKTPPNYILQLIVTSDAVKTLGASLRCFSQQSL